MTNTNRSNPRRAAENIETRHYSWFRLPIHAAVACALFAGMSGLTSAQIRLVTSNTYTLSDLSAGPTAPSSPGWSYAFAIDNSGQTVGQFVNLGGATRGFRTQPNTQINYYLGDDLAVLSTLTPNGVTNDSSSHAYAVSSTGVVVGDSNGTHVRAFRSNPGAALDDLNTTSPPNLYVIGNATYTHARGINDSGWIVGYYSTGTYDTDPSFSHSFVTFGPGWTQPIDSWYGNPVYSATYDVNNRGQVAGLLIPMAGNQPIAFLCNAGGNLIKIGTLGGPTSVAYALNDSGLVVGKSDTTTVPHAFLFQDLNNNGIADPGELKDLNPTGSVESAALSVNSSGTAVGYFGYYGIGLGDGSSRAAIFTNGAMTDLNNMIQGGVTPGWTLSAAQGINDRGQIVGFMRNSTGAVHAFRLDPVPPLRKL